MKKILAVTFILFCATELSAQGLSDIEKDAVKTAMIKELKDSDSAKYIWLDKGLDNGYCGLVNAKNSYGAYAGYIPFVSVVVETDEGETVALILQIGSSDDKAEVVRRVCVDTGGYKLTDFY